MEGLAELIATIRELSRRADQMRGETCDFMLKVRLDMAAVDLGDVADVLAISAEHPKGYMED